MLFGNCFLHSLSDPKYPSTVAAAAAAAAKEPLKFAVYAAQEVLLQRSRLSSWAARTPVNTTICYYCQLNHTTGVYPSLYLLSGGLIHNGHALRHLSGACLTPGGA